MGVLVEDAAAEQDANTEWEKLADLIRAERNAARSP
jgi:hypothetical protein